jgi:hypothetical protein
VQAKLREKLTTRRALVVLVGVLLALAWAVPSIGASTAKLARKAFARANLAYHYSDLAIDTSNKARTTATQASGTADAAKTTANQAQSAASQAQSTANTALSVANGAAHVQAKLTKTFDPGNLPATSCESSTFSQLGVLASDGAIVTPPDTQPLGVIAQAVTSTNQFTLQLCNVTSSAIDPPSGTYKVIILR